MSLFVTERTKRTTNKNKEIEWTLLRCVIFYSGVFSGSSNCFFSFSDLSDCSYRSHKLFHLIILAGKKKNVKERTTIPTNKEKNSIYFFNILFRRFLWLIKLFPKLLSTFLIVFINVLSFLNFFSGKTWKKAKKPKQAKNCYRFSLIFHSGIFCNS